MTVKELIEMLQTAAAIGSHGEDEVRIDLDMPSLGAKASTGLKAVYTGFDWEQGTVRLVAEEKIAKEGSTRGDPKRPFEHEDQTMSKAKGKPYIMRYCPRCQNSVKKKQRYCSACGQALLWEGDGDK